MVTRSNPAAELLVTGICTGVPGSLVLEDQIPAPEDEVMFGTPVGNPDVLADGTVSGGTPCKSIFEVLIAERLDTARAVLQAWRSPRTCLILSLLAQPQGTAGNPWLTCRLGWDRTSPC